PNADRSVDRTPRQKAERRADPQQPLHQVTGNDNAMALDACAGHGLFLFSRGGRARSSISTVAVMPAERTTPGGTSSIWMRTGMRWARRTQVKMGLTVATP